MAALAAIADAVRTVSVSGRSDVLSAGELARRLALGFGFPRRRAREVAIVVCELASNLVKHAGGGEVTLTLGPAGLRPVILVVASDHGPPIRDLAIALADGCDGEGPIDPALLLRRGGLGTGLGAVLRFADLFEYREEEGGKSIRVSLSA